jgi:G:T-mismatch repair DNA endonuclease (very short patch repair protein)
MFGPIKMFYIIAVLAMGNPSHLFYRVEIPTPVTEAQCWMAGRSYIDREERIQAMREQGWRLVMWDCSESTGL